MDFYEPSVKNEPKILPSDYVQSVDNMSAEDFLKIYLETLRYQDPFNQTDISKSLDDMVKINQIKYFTEMQQFIENLKTWMNQVTFLNTATLIGKEFIFRTDTLDTIQRDTYYIISDENYSNVKVRIYDGEELVKEITMDLKKGLNQMDVSELPRGQFTIKIFHGDIELKGWSLGFKDTVKAVGIMNGELTLDLSSGLMIPSDRIIYIGG
ncbi:MAG TPA: flagellar hook assembly protein FlgD [Aquificaceae bacterium]|nr:flagellar hook assembly protein FlgD [Aquificaceae bacterium]